MPDGNRPGGVMNDPRVAELVSELTGRVGAVMADTLRAYGEQQGQTARVSLEQMFAKFKEAMAPQNRVVPVLRRDENNNLVPQQTTTPQMLAELNDNIADLIAEIQYANELAEKIQKQNNTDDSRGTPPRRPRRRR